MDIWLIGVLPPPPPDILPHGCGFHDPFFGSFFGSLDVGVGGGVTSLGGGVIVVISCPSLPNSHAPAANKAAANNAPLPLPFIAAGTAPTGGFLYGIISIF
jgi:hypothetical protein